MKASEFFSASCLLEVHFEEAILTFIFYFFYTPLNEHKHFPKASGNVLGEIEIKGQDTKLQLPSCKYSCILIISHLGDGLKFSRKMFCRLLMFAHVFEKIEIIY